ncbi:MAG: AMP-binding protein [Vicinamibacterales bacterium]
MTNFHARIADAAARFGARPAVEMAGQGSVASTSYQELIALADGCAGWLMHTAGVVRGDRVAILAPNHTHWVAVYLGVLKLGAVAVPLDTAYTAAQITTILDDCDARVVVTTDRHVDLLAARVETPRTGSTGPSGRVDARGPRIALLTDVLQGVALATSTVPVDDTDAAVILYTSGTTADPKGVVLTHGNLEAERAGALSVIRITETDAVLGVLPLFHALAQMTNLLLPLTAGARVVFLESVSSSTLLEALATRGISVFACVPQFFYLIHERVVGETSKQGAAARILFRMLLALNVRLRDHLGLNPGRVLFGRVHRALGPQMRWLITGGSRFDPQIARDLYGLGVTLLNGYGLTETSGAATVVRPGDRFTTSVGPPLPGVEIKIQKTGSRSPEKTGSRSLEKTGSRSLQKTGSRSPETRSSNSPDAGEILIRGGIVMREYFRQPDATRDAMAGGWLRTGDLGFLDTAGRLHITGRLKEIIVLSSGKNLYPEEIEAHYRRSIFIKEICVLGVTRPGAPSSERLHAIVVPDPDVLRAKKIVNVRELIRFEMETLAVQLPAHKRVLSYDIRLEPLPRTTTGKLKRAEIAKAQASAIETPATGPTSPDEDAWLASAGRPDLLQAIAVRTGRPAVKPDANLELDLGLDSMERVELLTFVEERRGAQIAVDRRATIFSVRQLVEAVEDAAAGTGRTAGQEPSHDAWQTLLAEPADTELVAVLARPSRVRAIVIGLLLRVTMLFVRLIVRLGVEGRERLPARGPYIVCPNHQSHLDGFVLAAIVPLGVLRQLFFVGASEYFETPLARRVARLMNIVPVDPDAHLLTAMRVAASGLRLGKVLVVFPEGERSIDGQIKPFRKGAAMLSAHLHVPVVPVGIDGLHALWPRGRGFNWRVLLRPWRRPLVRIAIGAPLHLTEPDAGAATATLQQHVVDLLASS